MIDSDRELLEQRVLVLAPTSKDAALTRSFLERAEVACVCCRDLNEVCDQLEHGAGALLLTEEALELGRNGRLAGWLAQQPPWSDLPVLVLARLGNDSPDLAQTMNRLGNVTVLERPTRLTALVSAVRTALRARLRQYQIRDHLADQERNHRMHQLLASIVLSSDDAIVSKSLDGIIQSWNAGAERIFGYTAQEAIGRHISMIIPPDRMHEEEKIFSRLRRGERVEHFETVRVRSDGQLIQVSLTISPTLDETGRVVGASKIARDISERKQSERAALRATERLRLLWDAATVLLTAEDPDSMLAGLFERIRQHLELDAYFNFMVNDAGDALRLASFSGIPEEEARKITRLEFGQAVCGTVALQRQPIVANDIQQSDDPRVQLVKGYGIRVYACNPLMVGQQLLGTLSFASRSRTQFQPDELEFLQIICRYVAAAYERLHLIKQLQEADRRKDEFLALLAHELRNPLAPIRNSMHILRMSARNDPTAERVGEMMERQVGHMVRLVDDLMEVSRITRGKIELRKETIEVAAVVRSAVETSRPLIENAGHQLALTLPADPLMLEGDPVRLGQVFANLLNNAAKYTDPGGQIWLTVRRDGNEVVIAVRDTGAGIPAEMLPRVFDMFTQVERTADRAQGGLGIGLTLVKSLVEMHGGTVMATSSGLGRGSEFSVRLPLSVSRRSAGMAEPEPRTAKVLAPSRVLVVDDNRDAAQSLGMLLQVLGADVKTAFSGAEALETIHQFHPTVVLLDIGMPGMDGHEVARRIRQQPEFQDVMLIALTGWGQDDDRRRSESAGFNHHLTKPADVGTLKTLLNSLAADPANR